MRLKFVAQRLLLAFLIASPALAQAPASAPSTEDVLVLGNWRSHAGDDPAWAAPGFDDSGWVSSGMPAREPGRTRYHGYRWYRATVDIPNGLLGRDLGVGVGPLDEVYEVFVEGISVGRFGHWDPRPESPHNRNVCFRVPARLISGNTVHVALRRWNASSNTAYYSFYTSGAARFGHPIEIGLYSTMQSRIELYATTGIVKN
jgi:hypothetical protein